MEKPIKIKTSDKHIIDGTLTKSERHSNALLIFVHGLTGYPNEHQFFNGARYFSRRGFNVFRFYLYSGSEKGRLLTSCTISTHARDLNTVVRYFRKKFKKIFVVGHSLGGPTILLSDTSLVDGIVLWDSAEPRSKWDRKYFKYNKCLDAYIINWGTECIMGKKMYEERMKLPTHKELIQRIHTPIKVIVAEKGILQKAGREYFKYAHKPKEFAIIKNAGHTFDEEGVEEELFKETYNFLRKYTQQ